METAEAFLGVQVNDPVVAVRELFTDSQRPAFRSRLWNLSKSDCLRFQTIPNDTCLTKKESCVNMIIGVIAHYEFVGNSLFCGSAQRH